jgi:large subunit ribosomal protein L10
MKTKVQKKEELARAKKLLEKSKTLIFADFTKIKAEDIRKLRKELNKSGANFLVIKKRLLSLLLKEKGIESPLSEFKTSIGTIFSEKEIENGASQAFKFLSSLEIPEGSPRDLWLKHLLGGYDIAKGDSFDGSQIIFIGKLPSREILLSQLLGVISGPIRSFLYVLDQKSKKVELTQASN